MKYTLILSALLALGVALGTSAAPKHLTPNLTPKLTHKKHAAKPAPVARPASTTPGAPGGFRDVPPDHWAAKAVETLRQGGIVKGYPDSGK